MPHQVYFYTSGKQSSKHKMSVRIGHTTNYDGVERAYRRTCNKDITTLKLVDCINEETMKGHLEHVKYKLRRRRQYPNSSWFHITMKQIDDLREPEPLGFVVNYEISEDTSDDGHLPDRSEDSSGESSDNSEDNDYVPGRKRFIDLTNDAPAKRQRT